MYHNNHKEYVLYIFWNITIKTTIILIVYYAANVYYLMYIYCSILASVGVMTYLCNSFNLNYYEIAL